MEKMNISYYPGCSSNKKFGKMGDINGTLFVEKSELYFIPRFSKTKKFSIQLHDIKIVERCNLNGFMPFGVLLVTNQGEEYMIGHMLNKKLEKFITENINRALHL